MTLRAARDVALSELLPVDLLMTVFTLGGRGLEIHIEQPRLQIRGLMATDATGHAVRTQQREFRFRVIEP